MSGQGISEERDLHIYSKSLSQKGAYQPPPDGVVDPVDTGTREETESPVYCYKNII